MKPGETWATHQRYIADHPPPAKAPDAGAYLRHCPGKLVVELNDGRQPMLVVCDACGFDVGVPQEKAQPLRDDPLEGSGVEF